MEKSLKFIGIVRVTPFEIMLKAGDGISLISLTSAVREMMGVDIGEYDDVPCEFTISMNRYDDCFEINGQEFEVKKGE